jgi:hypothetical protein
MTGTLTDDLRCHARQRKRIADLPFLHSHNLPYVYALPLVTHDASLQFAGEPDGVLSAFTESERSVLDLIVPPIDDEGITASRKASPAPIAPHRMDAFFCDVVSKMLLGCHYLNIDRSWGLLASCVRRRTPASADRRKEHGYDDRLSYHPNPPARNGPM